MPSKFDLLDAPQTQDQNQAPAQNQAPPQNQPGKSKFDLLDQPAQNIPQAQNSGEVDWLGALKQGLQNSVRPVGQTLGSIAGGAVGSALGPEGTAGGAVLGNLGGNYVANGLQRAFPQIFGQPTDNTSVANESVAGELMGQGVMPAVMKGIQSFGRSLKPTAEGFPVGSSISAGGENPKPLLMKAGEKARANQDLSTNYQIGPEKASLDQVVQGQPLNDSNSANFAQTQLADSHPSLTSADRKLLSSAGKGSFEDNLKLREALKDRLKGVDLQSSSISPNDQILAQYSSKINTDLDQGFQQLGAQHYKDWQHLNDSYIQAANTFNSPMAQKALSLGLDPKTTYEQVANTMLKDASSAKQFLNVTGDRQTLSSLALKRVADSGLDPVNRTFDASKALQELRTNSDLYKTAIPSQTLSNYTQIFSNLAKNQKSNVMTTVTPYKAGLALVGAAELIGGHVPYALGAGAGSIVLKLGSNQLAKAMENPTLARALVEGSKTPFQAASSSMTAKIIARGLQGITGLTVSSTDSPDAEVPVKINSQGRIVPE